MDSESNDGYLLDELKVRSAKLFSSQGISEPNSVVIHPRSISNNSPRFISGSQTLHLVKIDDEKEYDSQINWAIAEYQADTHSSIFVRKASLIEWVLALFFALDGLGVLFLPSLMNQAIGLIIFIIIQAICLPLAWLGQKGKAERGKLIGEKMLETGAWELNTADWYIKSRSSIIGYIPLIGILIVALVGWTLFLL